MVDRGLYYHTKSVVILVTVTASDTAFTNIIQLLKNRADDTHEK
jgi:hypothetical protein